MEQNAPLEDSAPIDLAVDQDAGEVRVPRPQPSAPESAIDILWENQRGAWMCGLPVFSSASLLQFDPPAWLNGHGKPSAVDVTNAQTPDPTWQWAWPTWYVDMSQDVDEEGWQYSFMFRRKASWHGSHPWFHSYVRRRRWIRKRVKTSRHDLPSEGRKGKQDAHRLNADYFTIHPARMLTRTASSIAPSMTLSTLAKQAQDEEEQPEEMDSMAGLLRSLRRANVDREKVGLVMRFLDEGGDDVFSLADEMEHVMSLFMFQYTRRQLLQRMLDKITAAADHREEHEANKKPEDEHEKKKTDSLLHAVRAAEKQVQALEYWSDIRDLVQEGHTLHGAETESGWDGSWTGLDNSGAARVEPPKTDEHGHIADDEARTAGPA